MAKNKVDNKSAKARAIMFFLSVIVIASVLIGYLIYRKHTNPLLATAGLQGAPSIESIPGVGKTSSEYVKLQEQQNREQAREAERRGTSAVPTITRTSYFGPSDFQSATTTTKPACHPDNLRRARAAGVTVAELGCNGCSIIALKAAGYTAGDLAGAGVGAADLRKAGFTAEQLRGAGFTPVELKQSGFSAGELAAAGYSPALLARAAFTPTELRNADISAAALTAAGVGVAVPPNLPKNCSAATLAQAHAQNVPPAVLRNMGCGGSALRAADYTAAELAMAGFTPDELKAAGYTPTALRAAGFTAGQLRRAGMSAGDLRKAGFTPIDLKNAGFNATDLKNAALSPNELKAGGYTSGELLRAGFSPADLLPQNTGAAATGVVNCSVESLRQARAAGATAIDLRKRGCNAAEMLAAGLTPLELKSAGFSNEDLGAAGLTPAQIAAAAAHIATQCSVEGLRQARAAGATAAELRNQGCDGAAMLAAGFTPADLKAAGLSDDDLRIAGLTPAQIAAAGAQIARQCNVEVLRQARAAGATVASLRKQGCGGAAMLAAGFTPAELKAAGLSDADLVGADISGTRTAPGAWSGSTSAAGGASGVAGSAAIPAVGSSEVQLTQLQVSQAQQLNDQQRQQRLAQVQSSMVSQANSLFTTWSPPATQQYVTGELPKETATGATSTALPAPAMNRTGNAAFLGVDDKPCAYVKGGDIMMAVLTSTVNSDEKSPVMATIVSGKLKGAQLVGEFTLLKKKILISFNKMNLPGKPTSTGISAVAIDPQTAHTALADCVNNHYWLRYGTLFASSFLSGLADSISQQGAQTSTGAGGILVTHDPLSVGQNIAVALGAVGSQYASVLGSNFTLPPTVYVYAGDSIGVLFMQDLTEVPRKCCPDEDRTCNGGVSGVCATRY